MPVTSKQLQQARADVERLSGPYKAAVKTRQKLVEQALRDGMRPAEAARHAGISRQAVAKLG